MNNDFKPFGAAKENISKRQIDKSYGIYLSLYQAVTGTDDPQNIYKQFSTDFFDLIVIDECHRGSAAEDSAWREILAYFSSATLVGLTATPKVTGLVARTDGLARERHLAGGSEKAARAPHKERTIYLPIGSSRLIRQPLARSAYGP